LYFRMGKTREAETEYIAASHAFPGHPFAIVGYARVLAARGEVTSALRLVQDLSRTAPTPDLTALTGHLLQQLGRRDEAERQFALARAAGWTGGTERKTLARYRSVLR